jgi:glycosyltransferase involved in cell wall biosynthesis
VQNFVRAIASRNPDVQVHVVSFHYPYKPGGFTWHGAIVYALAGRNRRFPMRFRTWLQAAWRVRRLIASHHVIAVHSFWLAECTYVASWLARLTGTRHIASICGQDALSGNWYLKHLPFERMTITAGSGRAAEAFRQSTGRRVDHVIPTGLDSQALAAREKMSGRSVDILGVGSLSAVKDFRSFLEIIAELVPGYPALRCIIIGEGPERPSLEHQIQKDRLQDVVRLAGHVPREQVLNTMRKSRILLHTSRYEGQGYVLLEALASGMRVVCRDVGYTGNGTGVYRCQSSNEFVNALQRLLVSPLENNGVNVDSIDATARAFEKIYGIG